MDFGNQFFLPSASLWAFLPMIGTLLVHIAFSAAVFIDASEQKHPVGRLVFVGRFLWALAVLFGGVFVAVAYWLIHHSTLSKN
ncbi:MAG: hypothetical protein KKA56_05255 [Gammaproteobacteria bacterium]|nr:hypothetical protein [Gammaproteobacteria bacterium]